MDSEARLEIRLLGELDVRARGVSLTLPPSKKTRALLAYLALTARPHRRERLCSLLWDVADDPRGALRWSLSKLRVVLNEAGAERLKATRETVTLAAEDAWIDCRVVREALAHGGAQPLATEELSRLARLHRGELLEGLELPDFLEYQAWCAAEREQARRQRVAILRALVARLRALPEQALPFARELSQVDALDEQAHATLLELLVAADRSTEAKQYYESARRVLSGLGARGTALLDAAWRERSRVEPLPAAPPAAAVPVSAGPESVRSAAREALVGRDGELAELTTAVERVSANAHAGVLLITGEPGIGKSRLAEELLHLARGRGALTLLGRAFEAETTHPYGPWFDALRGLRETAEAFELLARGSAANREELFGAVAGALSVCTANAPVVLLLDDLQWCDEASTALLQHVLRQQRESRLCVLLTARSGELADNAAVLRLLRGLRRERLLSELVMGPLPRAAIAALTARHPGVDPDLVYERSAGNPLFAIELALAAVEHSGGELPDTLTELVRDRIERLTPGAGELVRWAAVTGRRFEARKLQASISIGTDDLVSAFETLERYQLVRAEADGAYAFTHELVRAVVYGDISDPRRRLMHLAIAQSLEPALEEDGGAALDLAHHAALAGDPRLAARACVRAGRRCLRLFANAEASALARRGRAHAEGLPEAERVPLLLELLQVGYGARRPEHAASAARELQELAERALDLGHLSQARLGFHLLSTLRWEGGAWSDAERYALEAERVSRSTDEQERMIALAEAGRCLAMLERDLGQAETLLLEAQALSRRHGREPSAVADALGLLSLHAGRLDEARELFRRSRAVARAEGDRAGEFQALEHLVLLELGLARHDLVLSLTAELSELAGKLREGSEMPFARALTALSATALAEPGAAAVLERALDELRAVDAKHRLAFTLTRAACLDLERGENTRALQRASEALAAARLLELVSEVGLALGVICAACAALGDEPAAERARAELLSLEARGPSAEVRAWLDAHVHSALTREVP